MSVRGAGRQIELEDKGVMMANSMTVVLVARSFIAGILHTDSIY
jgi:hypothetical protein